MKLGFGTNATDRLEGINYERMRGYRLERTRAMMRKHGIGTIVTWEAWDMRYIAAVYATVPCRWFESQFVILPVNGDPHVYGMTSFSPYVMREEMPWLKGKIFASPGSTKMNNTVEGIEGVIKTIEAVVREHGLENEPVGLDGCTSEFLVGEALSRVGLKAVDAKRCMFEARMIKSRDEIECVRTACTTAEAAFDAIKRAIRPGVKECELVGIGMERLYALGADETQEFVCSSGPRTNPLHVDFTDRMIRPGDLVIVDINGNSWQGYKSCYYRTFSCGKATQEQKEVYEDCRAMMYEGMKYIKAGVPASDVYKGFPQSPAYWGYGRWEDVAPYMLVHGLGLSLHELPWQWKSADRDSDMAFEEGMVLAIETWTGKPGGDFGVRLEENVAVTKDGYELLTKYQVDSIIECEI
ncbi:MAG: Xaa-Pro peptidase family protein [Clostridiales Family XIII bacterium]|nr:Xaa-Pro peptidase family protein [Clostridiales Family XIII bacterium]